MYDVDFVSETESQQSQTLIKQTFYQESIISGTNIDVPELKSLLNTPTVTSVTRKSSLTTRVTLNMRKCRRRSSDVGLMVQNQQFDDCTGNGSNSPHLTDARHSISGSPLAIISRNNSVETIAGRKLEQISSDRNINQATGPMYSNDQLQTSVCSSVLTGIFNGRVRNQ